MPQMMIAGRAIGPGQTPYMIAEISGNHNGDLATALSIMEKSQQAGASAIKIQTYTPDTITLKSDRPDFQLTEGLWAGRSLWALYDWAHTPWDWHGALFDHARNLGIPLFSSPFDASAIDLLEDLGAPAYKIASFEAIDLPLIRAAARTGKPMIISTGMTSLEEIGEAVTTARDAGCDQLALLHCVSSYPAPASDYNLHTLADMAERFDCVVGLSDHTLDNTTAIASVALGAAIIEKHVTLDRNGGGPDDSFSLEPEEFAELCSGAAVAWSACGQVNYGRKSSEQGNVQFRRSLYFVRALKAGSVIAAEDIRSVRPGFGAAPKHFDTVIGARVKRDTEEHTPVILDDLIWD